jgi:aryl-alcohol dehydrogenase-like predicted oxidoreductase
MKEELLMRYRLLGNSGLRVSEAALGTLTFGEDWQAWTCNSPQTKYRPSTKPAKSN